MAILMRGLITLIVIAAFLVIWFVVHHVWVLAIALLLAATIYLGPKLYKQNKENVANNDLAELNAAIALEISKNKLQTIEHVEFLRLNFGEVAYLVEDAVGYSPKTKNENNGFWGGISVPLPAHLHANLGKFKSSPTELTTFESYGLGKLILTNERIVFIHEFGNAVIPLNDKVLNVSAFNDGLRIDIASKKPWMFVTGNIRFYATYLKCQEELARLEIMNLANMGRSNFKNG